MKRDNYYDISHMTNVVIYDVTGHLRDVIIAFSVWALASVLFNI